MKTTNHKLEEGINLVYLGLSSKELSALYEDNEDENDGRDYLWMHPKGHFITDAGVELVKQMRKTKHKRKAA